MAKRTNMDLIKDREKLTLFSSNSIEIGIVIQIIIKEDGIRLDSNCGNCGKSSKCLMMLQRICGSQQWLSEDVQPDRGKFENWCEKYALHLSPRQPIANSRCRRSVVLYDCRIGIIAQTSSCRALSARSHWVIDRILEQVQYHHMEHMQTHKPHKYVKYRLVFKKNSKQIHIYKHRELHTVCVFHSVSNPLRFVGFEVSPLFGVKQICFAQSGFFTDCLS